MPTIELKDPTLELEITSDTAISFTSGTFLDMLKTLATLHGTVAMTDYAIERTGTSDEWVATAEAADDRVYTTTVTIVGGVAKYTLTSFPAATVPEVDAFLALIRVFVVWLKPYGVSMVEIAWL